MTFRPDATDRFLTLFDEVSPHIRAFPGCRHLELWRDEASASIFTTYSHWDAPAALSGYRSSSLFRETWARTRPLFAAPPEANSYTAVRRLSSSQSRA